MNNKDKSDIYIIIAAFNEENKIAKTIQFIQKEGYFNIIVIDDGSRDNTKKIASDCQAEVLSHVINRGQGAALRTGIEYVLENYNPTIIVTFDADGQHKADEIHTLIEPLLRNETDIVLGSRFLDRKTQVPFIRKIILKLGIIFTRFISDINITDTHNGFRALNKKASKKIKITQRGMEHASEIIDEIKKRKLSFKEVPVEIIYSDYSRKKGQRNSNFIKIGLKTILKKLL